MTEHERQEQTADVVPNPFAASAFAQIPSPENLASWLAEDTRGISLPTPAISSALSYLNGYLASVREGDAGRGIATRSSAPKT